jgi:transposase-like protein
MRSTRSENRAGSRRRRSVLEVEAILGEYAESGLTQRVFAREMGIGVSTLQYWLRRQGRPEPQRERRTTCGGGTSPEVSLIEVDLAGSAGSGGGVEERYEIEWANGTRLRVPRGFGKEELKTLVELVKEGT